MARRVSLNRIDAEANPQDPLVEILMQIDGVKGRCACTRIDLPLDPIDADVGQANPLALADGRSHALTFTHVTRSFDGLASAVS